MIKNISIIKKSSITITAFRINNKICKMTVGNTSFLFEETIRKKYDITKKIYLGEAILIFLKIGNKIRKQQEKLIIQKLQTRISIWKLKNDRIVNNRKIIIYLKELKQYLLKNKNNYKAGEYKARFYLQNSNLSSNYILFGDRKLSQIVLQDKGITHTILSKYYNKQSIRYKLLDRVFINQKETLINWNEQIFVKEKHFLSSQADLEKKQVVNTHTFLSQQQRKKNFLSINYLSEFINNYILEKVKLWNLLQNKNQISIKSQIRNTALVLNQQTIQQEKERLIDSSNSIRINNPIFLKKKTNNVNLENPESLLQQKRKLLETIETKSGQELSKKRDRKEKPEQNNVIVSNNWIRIEEESFIQKSSNTNWIKNRLNRRFLNQLETIINTVIIDKKQKRIEVLVPKERTLLHYPTFIWNQEVLWKKQVSINKNFLLNAEKLEKKQLGNTISFLSQLKEEKNFLNISYLSKVINNYILEKVKLRNPLQSKNSVFIKKQINNTKLGSQKSLLQQREKLIESSNLIIVDNHLFLKRQTSNTNLLNQKSLLQQKETLLETIETKSGQEFSKKRDKKEKFEQNNIVTVSNNWIRIEEESFIQKSSNANWIKNRLNRRFLNQLETIINTVIIDKKQKRIEVLVPKERTLLHYPTFIWNQEVLWKKQVSINKNFLLNAEKLEKKQLGNTISFLNQLEKEKNFLNINYLPKVINNYILEKVKLRNPLQNKNSVFIKKQINNTKLGSQKSLLQQREKLIESSNLIIVDNHLFLKRQTSNTNLLNQKSLLQQKETLLETITERGEEFSKKENRKEKFEQNNVAAVFNNWITIEKQKSVLQQREELLENIATKRQELSKKRDRKEKPEQNNVIVSNNWIRIEEESFIQKSSNANWIKNRLNTRFLNQLETIINTVITDKKQKRIEVLVPKERTLLHYPTFIWNQEVLWKKQVSINKNFLLNAEKLEKKQLGNTIFFLTQQKREKNFLNISYLPKVINNRILEKAKLWNLLQSKNQASIKRQISNAKLGNQKSLLQQKEKLIDSSNLIIVDNQLFFKRQTSNANLLNRKSLLQQKEKLLEMIIARGQEFSKKSNRKEKSEQNNAVIVSSNWNWITIEKEKLIQKSSNHKWIKNRLSRTFLNQLATITNIIIADRKQKKIEVLIPKERTLLHYPTFIWNQEVLWKKQVSINKNFLLNPEKLEKKQLVNILSFLTQQQKRKRVLNTSYLFESISNYILEKTNLWNLLQSKNPVFIKRQIDNAKLVLNQQTILQQKEKLIDSSNLIIVDNQLFLKRQTNSSNLLNRRSLLQQREKLLETIIARGQEFSKKKNRKEKSEQNNAVIVSKNWITIEKEKLIQKSSNPNWIKNRLSRTFLNQLETITNTIIANKRQKRIEVLIPKERTFLLYPTFIWNQAVLWKNQIFKKTRLWNLLQNKSELFIKKQDSNTKLVSNQKVIQQQRKLSSRKQGLLYNKNFKNSQVLLDKNISLQNNNSIHILNLFSIQNNPIITKQFPFLLYKQPSDLFAFYEKSDKEREKKDSIVLELRLEKEKQIEKEKRKELEKKIEEKEIQLHTILKEIKQQKERIKNLVKEQEQIKEQININSNITIKKWSKLVVNQFQEELQIEKIRYGLE